jgi:hypothetical protein
MFLFIFVRKFDNFSIKRTIIALIPLIVSLNEFVKLINSVLLYKNKSGILVESKLFDNIVANTYKILLYCLGGVFTFVKFLGQLDL